MDQELTYKWIQERLREMHAGTLAEQDKARLVEMAREDPFIADALEGFEAHPGAAHDRYLQFLTEKIRHVKRERRRMLIPNLTITAVAALVILMIGAYAVLMRLEKPDHETTFVLMSPDSLHTLDSLGDAVAIVGEEGSEPAAVEDSRQPFGDFPPSTVGRQESLSSKQKADANQKSTSDSNPLAAESEKSAAGKKSVADGSQPSTVDRIKEDEGYFANQMDPDMMSRRVTGRVTDKAGQPLIGAILNIPQTNLGTTSDVSGRFELFLPQPQSELSISLSGYQAARTTVTQGQEDVAVILPDTDIMEPGITMQTQPSTKTLEKQEVAEATGAAVIQNPDALLLEYLSQNSKFPLRQNYYMPGKEVTIAFTVNTKGRPEQIKVVSSSKAKSYDDEAVRLIRRGPDWVCDGGAYPCVKQYTIYFQ